MRELAKVKTLFLALSGVSLSGTAQEDNLESGEVGVGVVCV